MNLSVLAYNISFGRKLDKIEKWLLKDPDKFDVICLQEFPFQKGTEFIEKFKEYGFDYKFAPSSYLTKIFFSRGDKHGELTLYNTKKLKLIDDDIIKLGANFLEKRFRVEGQKTSILTVFKCEDKLLVMANSHLVCYAPNSRRINQIAKIIKRVERLGDDSKFSTVILGDFNYTSRFRQKKLIEYMAKNDFINAYKAHTHKYLFIPQQVDYVFYNNCDVKNVKINRKIKLSDHYPVQFTIEL
jgi:endonuclease/exonuclease/phosphatase family metal-dependent hydrolase